ncbi:MAG: FkbM family methyltransferase [Acidimicrobiaceae bacterium]|nr:FkbM family methyltransferase [Acidimicrobiaceae bacterium]
MTRDALDTTLEAVKQLDMLLEESVEEARRRESKTFEEMVGDRSARIVLFGAGGLGRRTLAGLRSVGVTPLAFSDNRRDLWGRMVDGIEVLSPEDAARQFGVSAAFVVTIWGAGSVHRFADSVNQLNLLGCDVVVPASWLSWRYAETLLPFYAMELPSKLLEHASEVRTVFGFLSDDRSRREYVTQVQWRLTGDPSCLSHPVADPQYLVAEVVSELTDDVVLDCGAYDGDTLRSWIESRGSSFIRYYALEPDPSNRRLLEKYIADLRPDLAERVKVFPYAVTNFTGTARFDVTGLPSSSFGDGQGIPVECVRLDDLEMELEGLEPTFVKADIEGAELELIQGGLDILGRSHPVIAIAAYHRQDHLWKVPLAIKSLWSEYRLLLRPHNEEGWDLVLYAVPPKRDPTGQLSAVGP